MGYIVHKKPDLCLIGTPAAGSDGEPLSTYTYAETSTRCAVYRNKSATESPDGTQAALTNESIYLPAGTDVTAASRLRVTKYRGTTLDAARDYAVIGAPHDLHGEIRCSVQRLPSGGSAT